MIKLVVVYDNESHKKEVIKDWGFSVFVKGEKSILFDTGRKEYILQNNLKSLGIDQIECEEYISPKGYDCDVIWINFS